MNPRLVLAANAVPKVGGQGLNLHHMVLGLDGDFDLFVFAREPHPQTPGLAVPGSRLAAAVLRTPGLRRLRDWAGWLESRSFDRFVAGRLPPAQAFMGVTGQCLESLKAARAGGALTAVDSVTTHIDDFGAHLDRECARFGVRPPIHRRLRERIAEEYRRADRIRVMSDHARSTFLSRGLEPERVFTASPPIDVEEFPVATFEDPVFKVSFVGLIEPWKGVHYLVEGFRAAALPESELVLWGGTGTRAMHRYLAAAAEGAAIRVRPVSVRQVGYGEVYGRSSVLVHPSLADGFGYVVAEAMASGIPVIVTSSTGAAELVEDGVEGYVVPPGDSNALAQRLTHLHRHPGLLREMGRAAREKIVKTSTPQRFRAALATAFGSVVAGRGEVAECRR